jgi:predicted transcriptional regulator
MSATVDKSSALRYYRTKSSKPNVKIKKVISPMARPKAKELTERELEVMHAFWRKGETTAAEVRDELEREGRELAYTTVATLVRILCEKNFLEQTNQDRPFRYRPRRTFDEVSGSIVGDIIDRVFGGKREQMLVRMLEERKLTAKERAMLQEILREKKS